MRWIVFSVILPLGTNTEIVSRSPLYQYPVRMDLTFPGSLISFSFSQPEKASHSISVTLSGTTTEESSLQPENI